MENEFATRFEGAVRSTIAPPQDYFAVYQQAQRLRSKEIARIFRALFGRSESAPQPAAETAAPRTIDRPADATAPANLATEHREAA